MSVPKTDAEIAAMSVLVTEAERAAMPVPKTVAEKYALLQARRWKEEVEARRMKFHSVPFLDTTPMDPDTPPSLTRADFKVPRLRQCPFDLDTVDWSRARILGAGMDGCVWRVHFGEQGPYVLKLFWDADPAPLFQSYFAAQRECQNAALLQMMRASLDQEAAAEAILAAGGTTLPDDKGPGASPILVLRDPSDGNDAIGNFYSFVDQTRRNRKFAHLDPPDIMRMRDVPMPRFAQCHGWLRVNAKELIACMPTHNQPDPVHIGKRQYRYLQEGQDEFIAIVYEYIHGEDGESDNETETEQGKQGERRRRRRRRDQKPIEPTNDRHKVAAVAKFLHLAGFQFCPQPLNRNWKNGVLVDHSDIIHPHGYGWQRAFYGLDDTDRLLSM